MPGLSVPMSIHGKTRFLLVPAVFVFFLFLFRDKVPEARTLITSYRPGHAEPFVVESPWKTIPVRHPVESPTTIPTGKPHKPPRVQHRFKSDHEDSAARELRLSRRDAVKAAFLRGWKSYQDKAWLSDELQPISGNGLTSFGGWAATLVDSLDTLWIMDLRDEFDHAVDAALNIDFDRLESGEINLFETTIRYLGGFLSAYDLSGDVRCLRKATELGEMLLVGFDTPNRMPITRWDPNAAKNGKPQQAHENTLLAEIGSLVMEFTRLALVTRDDRFYDAVDRITGLFEAQQMMSRLPGMWPLVVDARSGNFWAGNHFTLASMADSHYEYLAKMQALIGGSDSRYKSMYTTSMTTAINNILFRPMMPNTTHDILIAGSASVDESGKVDVLPNQQHLTCYTGGMFALGGRLAGIEEHVELGTQLMQGCVAMYEAFPLGIMAESFDVAKCETKLDEACQWNETRWQDDILKAHPGTQESATSLIEQEHLPRGVIKIKDTRYILRPEAIESVFVLYRITGRKDLLDSAWKMWVNIDNATKTPLANAALDDVTTADGATKKADRMESFWLAETLKYFYLIFSEPDLISLDEYVFNTEAHPFKRLV